MSRMLVALALCLATAFAHAPAAAAQDSQARRAWSALDVVPVGSKLKVEVEGGETVDGRLSAVSEKGLTLARKGRTVELERGRVRRVYRVGGPSVGKSTLIGMGVGTGAGAAIGAGVAAGDDAHESGEAALPVLVFGLGGAIVGTVTGLAAGLLGRKRVLIYESN